MILPTGADRAEERALFTRLVGAAPATCPSAATASGGRGGELEAAVEGGGPVVKLLIVNGGPRAPLNSGAMRAVQARWKGRPAMRP
ncbi:MAG: hypothetical protein ACLT5P_11005 [Flavonifractor plautii]